MSSITIDAPDDRPYGTGNTDYEYDEFRQRRDEEMNLAAQIFEQLDDANRAAAEYIAIGREQGRREGKAAIRAIVAAYDAALADPHTKIGTPLMCAIESSRKLIE